MDGPKKNQGNTFSLFHIPTCGTLVLPSYGGTKSIANGIWGEACLTGTRCRISSVNSTFGDGYQRKCSPLPAPQDLLKQDCSDLIRLRQCLTQDMKPISDLPISMNLDRFICKLTNIMNMTWYIIHFNDCRNVVTYMGGESWGQTSSIKNPAKAFQIDSSLLNRIPNYQKSHKSHSNPRCFRLS